MTLNCAWVSCLARPDQTSGGLGNGPEVFLNGHVRNRGSEGHGPWFV